MYPKGQKFRVISTGDRWHFYEIGTIVEKIPFGLYLESKFPDRFYCQSVPTNEKHPTQWMKYDFVVPIDQEEKIERPSIPIITLKNGVKNVI